jgi:hypothetical protein
MYKNMMTSTYSVERKSAICQPAYKILKLNIFRIPSNLLIFLISFCHSVGNEVLILCREL